MALAKISAARKDNKVIPYISPHLCKLYEFTEEEVDNALQELLRNAVKIPMLGRKSSFGDFRETMRSNRYREVEIVVQGMIFNNYISRNARRSLL